jgi:hypothetical protein
VDSELLADEDIATRSQEYIEKLNDQLERDEPNYGCIRSLFKRLVLIGDPSAVPIVASRAKELIPALADAGNYLRSVNNKFEVDWPIIGSELLDTLKLPIVQNSEYLTVILLDLYARIPFLNHVDDILRMYDCTSSAMVHRHIVRVATEQNRSDWLRLQKDKLSEADPWLRRAIIAGAKIFTERERDTFLYPIDQGGNKLEKIIVQWVKEKSYVEKKQVRKILFLAAEPTDASRLRAGEELREIQNQLQLSKFGDRFELKVRMSVRSADISQAIHDVEPQIVHFSGHGTASGELCIENEKGETHTIQPVVLATLFKQCANQVNCVVLNVCYAKEPAHAIAESIDYVIGWNQAIGDKEAIAFAVGFYQALGAGKTIEDAYEFGCAQIGLQIGLQDIPEHLVPALLKKEKDKSKAYKQDVRDEDIPF